MATINLPVTTLEVSNTLMDWRVAAEIVAAGQPIVRRSDDLLWVAGANSGLYNAVTGIAVASAQVGQRCWFALPGAELTVSGLTLGDSYYLAPGTNEVQTLTITGTPTGGTVVLRFNGQDTSALAYNAAASAVQAAFEALSNIGTGNVLAAGGPWPGSAITLTFRNNMGGVNQALITLQTNGLTGGTSPTLTPSETTPGARGGGLAPRADLSSGHYLVRLGVAKLATTFKFDPYVIGQI